MKLDKFQKAKIVLGMSFFVLLFSILFIPNIVNTDWGIFSEDFLETFFLLGGFFSVIYVFWHYDYVVSKREEDNLVLSSKLKNREKELLETFQYLGKVNVQFSIVRDLIDEMKKPAPTTQEELRETLKELLNIACSTTGREKAWLKIVDLKKGKDLIEERGGTGFEDESYKSKIAPKNLLKIYKNEKNARIDDLKVFYSELDNFYIKAFLILPFKEENKQNADFLKAVANQCEILFLLFNSQYYRPKNNKNIKK
jgi:hypothetical protein